MKHCLGEIEVLTDKVGGRESSRKRDEERMRSRGKKEYDWVICDRILSKSTLYNLQSFLVLYATRPLDIIARHLTDQTQKVLQLLFFEE